MVLPRAHGNRKRVSPRCRRGGRAGLAILIAAEPERQPAGSRGTVSAMVRPLLASLVAAAALLLSAGAAGAHTGAAGPALASDPVAPAIVQPAVGLLSDV